MEQNISIDAVSGATNSSLVIEKAIEKALTRGQQ
ncbi:MAG: FMN-binding protein [Lachnospiraceae bacterium]|nr:FMN-binding protein [Lachnospiraceae bacterium]